MAVEIADPDLCPRYGATVIRGVAMGDSPPWLKARLTHAGMRPISNVVDVTNYVMLAWGQPLHAFDAAKIRGDKLIARRATAGEKIVTLDGVERTLDEHMLVIADVERPLVIAGVFGSWQAEIDAHTTDIVLEAANFAGPSILRTEMHTGIRSEASNRFEKGMDANLVPGGLTFASRMLAELCGGTVAPGIVDEGSVPAAPAPVAFRPARCDALLGYAIPAAEQAGILRRLECEVDEGRERGRRRRGGPSRAHLPSRPRARGRPHRGGRPHRRLRAGARDAAEAHHHRRSDPAAAGAARRAARPGRLRPGRGHHLHVHRARRGGAVRSARRATPVSSRSALEPHERGAVGDAHHAAAGAAARRAREHQTGSTTRRTSSRSARCTCGTSRCRRRRTRPSRAPSYLTSRRSSPSS